LEAAGASVHYEQIRPSAEEDWAAASDSERAARPGMWKAQDRAALAACRYLDWVRQPFPLDNAASWRNVDLTDLDLVRRASPGNIREEQRAAEEADYTDDELETLMGAGMTIFTRLLALDRFGLLPRLAGHVAVGDAYAGIDRARTRERNRMALAALPPGGDVVLLWGSAHLPGLAAGLRQAGYRRQSTEWMTVGTLPALLGNVRTIWTALHSS
jgi:hypothetical protein